MQRTYFIKFLLGILWLTCVGTGWHALWRYAATEGEAARVPLHWPTTKAIPLAKDRATLLVTLHPRCPCSRATLGELAKIMAEAQTRVETFALFVRPPGVPVDWEQTALWQQAARIPGVHVLSDENGTEAQRFGVKTSGQALLYDPAGCLLFSGGITAGRGHAGDNEGRTTIVGLLQGNSATEAGTPVYGCSLLAVQDGCADQSADAAEPCPLTPSSITLHEFIP